MMGIKRTHIPAEGFFNNIDTFLDNRIDLSVYAEPEKKRFGDRLLRKKKPEAPVVEVSGKQWDIGKEEISAFEPEGILPDMNNVIFGMINVEARKRKDNGSWDLLRIVSIVLGQMDRREDYIDLIEGGLPYEQVVQKVQAFDAGYESKEAKQKANKKALKKF